MTTTDTGSQTARWTEQRYRIDRITDQLIEGLQIVEQEHPDTNAEWRAKWLGGWLADTILFMGMGIEAEARRLTVERLLQHLDAIAGPFDVIHDARSTIRAALAHPEEERSGE